MEPVQPHRRQETDRENLLAEATALVERVELAVESFSGPVLVGFRASGAASVFFDQDPAYHFNPAGELRRAYVAGQLYKAERRRLVALARQRDAATVHLVRHELDAAEQAVFLDNTAGELTRLAENLYADRFVVRGQAPANRPIVERVKAWLGELRRPIRIASTPNAGR